jgi:hypothetical protein
LYGLRLTWGALPANPKLGTASRWIFRLDWFLDSSAFWELGKHQFEEEWKQFSPGQAQSKNNLLFISSTEALMTVRFCEWLPFNCSGSIR